MTAARPESPHTPAHESRLRTLTISKTSSPPLRLTRRSFLDFFQFTRFEPNRKKARWRWSHSIQREKSACPCTLYSACELMHCVLITSSTVGDRCKTMHRHDAAVGFSPSSHCTATRCCYWRTQGSLSTSGTTRQVRFGFFCLLCHRL